MPDEETKTQDAQKKLVAQMVEKVTEGVTAEMKEQLTKMGNDIAKLGRQVEDIKAGAVTIEKQKEDEVVEVDTKILNKALFEGRNMGEGTTLNSLLKMWSIETTGRTDNMGVRKALYMPRTDFDYTRRIYKRDKSYDGFEDIMDLNDMCYFAGLAISHQRGEPFQNIVRSLDTWKLLNHEIQANSDLSKALDTTQNSEFIPTQFSARLMDDVRLALKVAALFPRIPLPRSPFTNPVMGTRQICYLVGEATSDSNTKIPTVDPASRNVTWTAIKFAVRNLFSDEFAEDSIIPVMPWVRSELVQALADGEEDAKLNGDATDTTHVHSDVTASNDRRKAYDGLLYHSGQSSGYAAVDISTLSTTNLRSIRKKMGRFGADPTRLAWIASISAYIQMLGLSEVQTVDKYGAGATILSGELGKFDGAPLIVSEFMRQDLNASGVYDGATTTKTGVLLAHTPSFVSGDVGSAKAESDRDIETGQTIVVTSRRQDFQQIHNPGASEETVGFGYNLAS